MKKHWNCSANTITLSMKRNNFYKKTRFAHSRNENYEERSFLVCAEHVCKAIVSFRASAHPLHVVLLFHRKFKGISYEIKQTPPYPGISNFQDTEGFSFRKCSF